MSVVVSSQFRARLNRVSSAARQAAVVAMEQGAEELVEAMRRMAPVLKKPDPDRRAGALRDSIRWTWGSAPKGAMVLDRLDSGRETAEMRITIYAGNKEAFYARFVEFGTRTGIPAQPFFYPAYRSLRRRIRARITREIRKAIQQEG